MVTFTILSPAECTPKALADFESLVREGQTVDPEGLTQRISDAHRLLFLRESNGQLVGVGALKHPLLSYRTKVFAKAGITTQSDEYCVELGWVAWPSHTTARIIASYYRPVDYPGWESKRICDDASRCASECALLLTMGLNRPVTLSERSRL
jgi:hypothetical protein